MARRVVQALVIALLLGQSLAAHAQGTAFSYDGRLSVGGSPANGIYDIRAGLYTISAGGTVFAGPVTNPAVAVSNGLFTITLDYGNVFDGTTYWLQVAVRTNGVGSFTVLAPRQQLTPTPYAIFAEGANAAGLSGTIPSASLAGSYSGVVNFSNPANIFAGTGSGLSNVNALTLDGLASGSFWQLGGNSVSSGAFLGTIDNQPLTLEANNQVGFQLQYWESGTFSTISYSGVNVIGGYWGNAISNNAVGATIAGGGYLSRLATFPPSSLSYPNAVVGDYGSIGGGWGNIAGTNATVSGGIDNVASGTGSFIGGGGTDGNNAHGMGNNASGAASVIGGGVDNNASTQFATVSGGYKNTASGSFATVPGGTLNIAGGYASFAAGEGAQTTQNNTFIWGDGSQYFNGENVDNGFNVLATGGVFFYNGTNGLHIDGLGYNDGTIDYALKFGGALSSGEGIGSKRTAGGNQFGLDFYTSSADRMSIDVNGHVGINTTSPSQRLEVNGDYILIDGHNANNGNGPIDAYIGGNGSGSDVQIGSMNSLITAVGFWNTAAGAWMHIACSSITINGGADVAEPFPLTTAAEEIIAGSVVVIDEENPGRLKLSAGAYDSHVAGVVSGANGVHPGIQMQQQGLLEGGQNVALTGRVYVRADVSNGAIKPGDLLTTSSQPGRAMKVTDHARGQGAILGKAMTGLNEGDGLVLVLVTLQ